MRLYNNESNYKRDHEIIWDMLSIYEQNAKYTKSEQPVNTERYEHRASPD